MRAKTMVSALLLALSGAALAQVTTLEHKPGVGNAADDMAGGSDGAANGSAQVNGTDPADDTSSGNSAEPEKN